MTATQTATSDIPEPLLVAGVALVLRIVALLSIAVVHDVDVWFLLGSLVSSGLMLFLLARGGPLGRWVVFALAVASALLNGHGGLLGGGDPSIAFTLVLGNALTGFFVAVCVAAPDAEPWFRRRRSTAEQPA